MGEPTGRVARREPILQLTGITKRFGSTVANDDVSFDLFPGEIHALVGENGAGKTTLMRVLYGMYRPDEGEILLAGEPVTFRRPLDSIRSGIGMVHQHFMLVPSFTILENVVLGAEPRHRALFDDAKARRDVAEPLATLGVRVDPDTITGSLNVATQQKVEIAKILYRGARIIILDEPTAVLTPQETDELFTLLRRLAAQGAAVIFISHKLREVFSIADRITVLRNGRTTAGFGTDQTSTEEVVAAMTGRTDVKLGRIERSGTVADIVLDVAHLYTDKPSHDAALNDVSFQVRAGEIVGIAGVEGNGQSILAETLIGTAGLRSGSITVSGSDVTGASVLGRRQAGMAYVAEDRHLEGLPMNGSVLEAITAGALSTVRGISSLRAAFTRSVRESAGRDAQKYSVKTAGLDARCDTLSGGNQQKIVIAREFEQHPTCLLLAQPTRGVDLGAIDFIYERIAAATASGTAVVLISADLDEILRLSDRVLVMYGGQIVADEITENSSREQLGMYMMGAAQEVA